MSFCKKISTSNGKPGLVVMISPELNHRLEGRAFELIIGNGGKVTYGEVQEDYTVRIVAEFKEEEMQGKANRDIWKELLKKETDYVENEED